jgi:hypothetical protein
MSIKYIKRREKTMDNDFILSHNTKQEKRQILCPNIALTCLKKDQTDHNIVGFPAK